jgi:uncharacterized protein
MKNGLIIFARNPRYGKVKTRLAASLGNETALAVYTTLLRHTKEIAAATEADKFLFYSDSTGEDKEAAGFTEMLQQGSSLGQRMQHAFDALFAKGYEKLVIIGSDCLELTTDIIHEAFSRLDTSDVVIGPAKDGGYYLLGIKESTPVLFRDISWSTPLVLRQTMAICEDCCMRYSLLPELADIDEAADWQASNQNNDKRYHTNL